MPLDRERVRQALKEFDFFTLFIEELGWDRHHSTGHVATVDDTRYQLDTVAQKHGMVVFVCEPSADGFIPGNRIRRKIEGQARRVAHEHIIIFVDGVHENQRWQWVRREPGKPAAFREHLYHHDQPGDALIQKLEAISFDLDDEEGLTIAAVDRRARQAFDVDRITKRFYERFKAEHSQFLDFIKGIPSQGDREWYASLMLNRLMFAYFIQKKGFLDGDRSYLRNKLELMQAKEGKDKFLSFYRHFLLRLFHEGLGQRSRSKELDSLIGRVPYLNGGLFDVHQLEKEYPDVEIADDAFEKIFDFFDRYQWHLDDRPSRADNEINPDVLGYIFEKYVNQKQMGAYYTKEDITQYLTANALVPCFFEKLGRASTEFSLTLVTKLLSENPDRYIPVSIRHGADLSLPKEVEAGLDDAHERGMWNAMADPDFGLPGETWRDALSRRQYYSNLRTTLAKPDLRDGLDLVSLNIDLSRLAEDFVSSTSSLSLLIAINETLESLKVLDPTCGSGAFLFSALNLLQSLYEECLGRMETLAQAQGASHEESRAARSILGATQDRLNPSFFILKTIMVNNLYGVDIMEEAVEICKLRLFLRLVSEVEEYADLEPLPDIDFNVRVGNSLIGFASREQLDAALGSKLDLDQIADRIELAGEEAASVSEKFRELQLAEGIDDHAMAAAKADVRSRLAALRNELDTYLAAEFGHNPTELGYGHFLETHLPFHWFVEFHEVMAGGGFDAIVGNPPFVEYAKVREQYSVRGYASLACNNLYAFVLERSLELLSAHGRLGMIAPLSLASTPRMAPIRSMITKDWELHIPCFDIRPNALFEGVAQRLCFVLARKANRHARLWTAGYRRWHSAERVTLLSTERFISSDNSRAASDLIPKFSLQIEKSIRAKLGQGSVKMLLSSSAKPIYVHRIVRYFVKAVDFAPLFVDADGTSGRSADYKEFRFSPEVTPILLALLNSSLFYWYWRIYSDGYHCGYGDVYLFPHEGLSGARVDVFEPLVVELMQSLQKNSVEKTISTRRGRIRYQEFHAKPVKPQLDEIDGALAEQFNFTAEELDFLINYDLKYRVGSDE